MGQQRSESRRRFLAAGATTAGAVWAAPSILRVDRAGAATGSCLPYTVQWASVASTAAGWRASGALGDLSVVATIVPNLSRRAVGNVSLSGADVAIQMSRQQIGDFFAVSLSFTATTGTILDASTRIVDVDQNGIGLGCVTTSRFRDEITNLTGPGLTVSAGGSVVQAPPGTWATALVCKTNDTETLTLAWSSAAGVTSGGFRWVAGTPPGSIRGGLDLQLIKLTPPTLCVQGTTIAASIANAARGTSPVAGD